MKTISITRLDKNGEDIADGLLALGMTRISALSLAGIRHFGKAKTRELESLTGLRQPEVSIGVRQLIEKGWIKETEEKLHAGKGRPTKVYSLIVTFEDILTQLTTEKNAEAKVTAEKILRLKTLAKTATTIPKRK